MKTKKINKKHIFAIFAHPDDEAFGPAGTIATLARDYHVHLICITSGDAKYTPVDADGWSWEIERCGKYAKQRELELTASAKALGIEHVHFLRWQDGELSNDKYHLLAKSLKDILDKYQPEKIITFEPRGLTGHIDHIIVTSVINFIAPKLSYIQEVLYFCFIQKQREFINDYFIFFPPGYKKSEVDMEVDVSSVWEKRTQSIYSHKSQQLDIQFYMPLLEGLPKKEYFLVKKMHA